MKFGLFFSKTLFGLTQNQTVILGFSNGDLILPFRSIRTGFCSTFEKFRYEKDAPFFGMRFVKIGWFYVYYR